MNDRELAALKDTEKVRLRTFGNSANPRVRDQHAAGQLQHRQLVRPPRDRLQACRAV